MKRYFTILFLFVFAALQAQETMIQNGPMMGYIEMKEAAIWLQTTRPATVYIKYFPVNNKKEVHYSNRVVTTYDHALTAHLIADTLEPGTTYNYQLYIDGEKTRLPYSTVFTTQQIWKWRTDAPDFKFAMGSGAYINETAYDRPGKPYGGGYEIYDHIAGMHPDFFLWLGDNIYLREPDWNTRAGIFHRYSHDRAIPQLQKLWAVTHHYAILDDHDFGPNDSDRSFWNKNETLNAFKLFWANPSYGVGDLNSATTFFSRSDCDFFLLDNRTFRSPDKRIEDNKSQLGEEQLQWLFDNLVNSYGTFKFVVMGGQFLSNSGMFESYTNYGFAAERQRIIDFIYKQKIKNVVFLTGDVHFSEVSVLRKKGQPVIWDITSSPLNSGVNTYGDEQPNSLRIPGSVIMERNFTLLEVTGKKGERALKVTYYGTHGDKLYQMEIKPEE
jgi:alkaline phosphatase D